MKDDVVVQPFGRNVPFSLERNENGLLISMRIQSIDGKIVAEIRRNKWRLNQNNYFLKNFDEHALEVVGQDGVTYLQIEYLDTITLRIGGVFFAELSSISNIYPDFPSVPDNVGEIALFKGPADNMIILGKGTMVIRRKPGNPSEEEEIRAIAKSSIETWFDYSDPEKIGIRKKQETDESITINKKDRKKYSKLTNEQLKAEAMKFVHDLRELLLMCDKEREAALAKAKSNEEFLNALSSSFSDEYRKRIQAEYDRKFKVESIILRDELISRLPKSAIDDISYHFYENPVNLIGCDKVADDLERLANNL
jgi:hypothetical protein